jgi:hypothetical protein
MQSTNNDDKEKKSIACVSIAEYYTVDKKL